MKLKWILIIELILFLATAFAGQILPKSIPPIAELIYRVVVLGVMYLIYYLGFRKGSRKKQDEEGEEIKHEE